MSRAIPKCRTWRVTLFLDNPQEKRTYYVQAPTKLFAWWNSREEILVDIGAARFVARLGVTIGLMRSKSHA